MRDKLKEFRDYMNEDKMVTGYYLDNGTKVTRISYKGHDFWINPKKGDKQVFLFKSSKFDDNKADLNKPVKETASGKTVMLKIKDLYGLSVYPGD